MLSQHSKPHFDPRFSKVILEDYSRKSSAQFSAARRLRPCSQSPLHAELFQPLKERSIKLSLVYSWDTLGRSHASGPSSLAERKQLAENSKKSTSLFSALNDDWGRSSAPRKLNGLAFSAQPLRSALSSSLKSSAISGDCEQGLSLVDEGSKLWQTASSIFTLRGFHKVSPYKGRFSESVWFIR